MLRHIPDRGINQYSNIGLRVRLRYTDQLVLLECWVETFDDRRPEATLGTFDVIPRQMPRCSTP